MRPKEHPELVFDVIPKLYDRHTKVIITNLFRVHQQLQSLPLQFCKMFTTQPLAKQLLKYLLQRDAKCISEKNFVILEDCQPFKLRLSDGCQLELMLCAGSALGNSLVLLIRRPGIKRLLYCYSAVQQDDLTRLCGNRNFNAWIVHGSELLWLNLEAAEKPFQHVDYDALAISVPQYGQRRGGVTLLMLPPFGFEHAVAELRKRLGSAVKLLGSFKDSYALLGEEQLPAERGERKTSVNVCSNWTDTCMLLEKKCELPLSLLRWSPLPTRINLRQLCSLVRPLHIRGIVGFHSSAHTLQAPSYLKELRGRRSSASPEKSPATKSPPATQPATQPAPSPSCSNTKQEKDKDTGEDAGRETGKETCSHNTKLRVYKKRKLAYLKDMDESEED